MVMTPWSVPNELYCLPGWVHCPQGQNSGLQNMKIAVAGLGYFGKSNAVLLAQHNEVVGITVISASL